MRKQTGTKAEKKSWRAIAEAGGKYIAATRFLDVVESSARKEGEKGTQQTLVMSILQFYSLDVRS